MAQENNHAHLDHQAEEIADCLNELPWCESTSFLVVEDEDDEPEADLNHYLQAFEVLVFDGYVTDFMRIVQRLNDGLQSHPRSGEIHLDLSIPYLTAEDPNQVPLTMMVHYDGAEEGYYEARKSVLETFGRIVRDLVDEYAREEDDEAPIETLV
ncbi:MAG: hypothetical protein KY468_13155 [Armatimonadetes bacterium]|nr:hypothetical protein [Armatimonadota bacterium]